MRRLIDFIGYSAVFMFVAVVAGLLAGAECLLALLMALIVYVAVQIWGAI